MFRLYVSIGFRDRVYFLFYVYNAHDAKFIIIILSTWGYCYIDVNITITFIIIFIFYNNGNIEWVTKLLDYVLDGNFRFGNFFAIYHSFFLFAAIFFIVTILTTVTLRFVRSIKISAKRCTYIIRIYASYHVCGILKNKRYSSRPITWYIQGDSSKHARPRFLN